MYQTFMITERRKNMKNILIKYNNHFSAVMILGIGIGTLYPDETANDNYISAGIYVFAALCAILSLIGTILKYFVK